MYFWILDGLVFNLMHTCSQKLLTFKALNLPISQFAFLWHVLKQIFNALLPYCQEM